jgi:hypothetical protein
MLHELLHHYHVLVYSFSLNARFKIMCFTFKIMCFTFSIDIADINKENSKHYELLVV